MIDFELERKKIISITILSLVSSLISLIYVVILKKAYAKSNRSKIKDDSITIITITDPGMNI
jgi:hypothetical protein